LRSISGCGHRSSPFEVDKIEREEDESGRVAAVGCGLDHAVGAHAAQFTVEIGLPGADRGDGHRDRRIFVRSVKPGAGEQPHGTAIEAGVHAGLRQEQLAERPSRERSPARRGWGRSSSG
jgi:hypothetical protein